MAGHDLQTRSCRFENSRGPLPLFSRPSDVGGTRCLFLLLCMILVLSPIGLSSLDVYPSDCTAGVPCKVYFSYDGSLSTKYKCSAVVLDDNKIISKLDVKPISSELSKSIASSNSLLSVNMPKLGAGEYILNVECTDGLAFQRGFTKVQIESPKLALFGTEYSFGEKMKLFSQLLIDELPYDNATCLLSMYSPDNSYYLHNVEMTGLGGDGLYYYDGAYAPNVSGVYMASTECTYPSLDIDVHSYNYTVIEDTYIDENRRNANYGTATTLIADNVTSGKEKLVLIKVRGLNFSSFANKSVLSAVLRIYHVSGSSVDVIYAYQVTSPWNESTVTWNSRPTINMTSPVSFRTAGTYQEFYDFDMTSYFESCAAETNSSPCEGVAFRANGGVHSFYSSEFLLIGYTEEVRIRTAIPSNRSMYVRQVAEIKIKDTDASINQTTTRIEEISNEVCKKLGGCVDDYREGKRETSVLGIFSIPDYHSVPEMYDDLVVRLAWVNVFIILIVIILTYFVYRNVKMRYFSRVRK